MIDNRFLAYVVLGLVLLLIYQAWQVDYAAPPAPSSVATNADAIQAPQDLPTNGLDVPAVAGVSVGSDQPQLPEVTPAESTAGKTIRVISDALSLEIDLQGGTVSRALLLNYPVDLQHPNQLVELFTTDDGYYVAQSGMQTGAQAKGAPAPNHYVLYRADAEVYEMPDDANELRVPLSWSDGSISATKTFVLKRGSYDISVQHRVQNNGEQSWFGRQYRQLQRTAPKESNSKFFIHTYTGGVIYSPENKYEKISFDDLAGKPLDRTIASGWAAMIQHYFLSAWVPNAEESNSYYSLGVGSGDNKRYVLGLSGPITEVPAGTAVEFNSLLYVGPKVQDHLEAIAPGLELTVDYGWLTIIAQPMFLLLKYIHKLVGNWGWAIVLVTLLIKLAFYKLSEASYRSMAKMRKFQPKMMAIRERYPDDRQRQSQAMMELYRKEKINPLGGCLPMLIQIPFFIALYWVLLESVELRQAGFIFWINDLSVKDPYYVLPIIMGITMYIQQKLNPAPLDPVQAKVFMVMPYVFTVFFAFFPSGLVLYWVVNNTLTIAQQWFITHRVLDEKK